MQSADGQAQAQAQAMRVQTGTDHESIKYGGSSAARRSKIGKTVGRSKGQLSSSASVIDQGAKLAGPGDQGTKKSAKVPEYGLRMLTRKEPAAAS